MLSEEVGDFGELVYAGMDFVDEKLAKRSMELMATEVMPRVNAAIRNVVTMKTTADERARPAVLRESVRDLSDAVSKGPNRSPSCASAVRDGSPCVGFGASAWASVPAGGSGSAACDVGRSMPFQAGIRVKLLCEAEARSILGAVVSCPWRVAVVEANPTVR